MMKSSMKQSRAAAIDDRIADNKFDSLKCTQHFSSKAVFIAVRDHSQITFECNTCIVMNAFASPPRHLISIDSIYDEAFIPAWPAFQLKQNQQKNNSSETSPSLTGDPATNNAPSLSSQSGNNGTNLLKETEQAISDELDIFGAESISLRASFSTLREEMIELINDLEAKIIDSITPVLRTYDEISQKQELRTAVIGAEKSDVIQIISSNILKNTANAEKLRNTLSNQPKPYRFIEEHAQILHSIKDLIEAVTKTIPARVQSSQQITTRSDLEKKIAETIKSILPIMTASRTQIPEANKERQPAIQLEEELPPLITVTMPTLDFDKKLFGQSVNYILENDEAIQKEIQYSLLQVGRESKVSGFFSSAPSMLSLLRGGELSPPQRNVQQNQQLPELKGFSDRLQKAIQRNKCKYSNAIKQDGATFSNIDYKETYSIGYVEAAFGPNFIELTKSKSQNHIQQIEESESFSISIEKLSNWIGVGVVLVDKQKETQKDNQDAAGQQERNSKGQNFSETAQSSSLEDSSEGLAGYCMLSHNGYIWSSKNISAQSKSDSLLYSSGDVLIITRTEKMLSFKKKGTETNFEIYLPSTKDIQLYPGFILYSFGDEVKFVNN